MAERGVPEAGDLDAVSPAVGLSSGQCSENVLLICSGVMDLFFFDYFAQHDHFAGDISQFHGQLALERRYLDKGIRALPSCIMGPFFLSVIVSERSP